MSVKIDADMRYLGRAVDHDGEALEAVVTKRCDKRAALKSLGKPLRRHGRAEEIATDRQPSYRAALRELDAEDIQTTGRWLNNRIENSHQPFRR